MINKLFRFSWFPLVFQILTLSVFVMLIIGGLFVDTDDMAFAMVVRNTNVSNLIVWSYWWPLIILSAIFFGRVWCMVCPMELVTTLASVLNTILVNQMRRSISSRLHAPCPGMYCRNGDKHSHGSALASDDDDDESEPSTQSRPSGPGARPGQSSNHQMPF